MMADHAGSAVEDVSATGKVPARLTVLQIRIRCRALTLTQQVASFPVVPTTIASGLRVPLLHL
jgi:hypothetical protein